MSIRILHIVNNLGKGGLENGLVNLIERMDAHRFEHVVCTVRGLGPNAERLPMDRVQVVSVAGRGWSQRVQTPALVRTIRRFRPDVVHTRNWAAVEGVVAARIARAPAVVHSEHGFEGSIEHADPRRRTLFRRMAYELADQVVAVSYQLRSLHAARTGFPENRIAVIHNGVDRGRFCADQAIRTRVRRELGVLDTDVCLGSVGNLLPVKDHMTLLRACAELGPGAAPWRLLVVGEGPERARLEAFTESRQSLKGHVSFLGSSKVVADVMRAMDIFVLPSVAEGMCNALLEAMATGLPIVATAVGGNPEAVVDGKSALLFPAGDVPALSGHLLRLLSDAAARTRLAKGALQRVTEEFSMESMVHAYERLYLGVRHAEGMPALSAS
jgi:sugar transferase (PEP-CTERM/EpsH1 system associated)